MLLRRHSHEAMFTRFELILPHEDPLIANGIAQAVFSDIDRLEKELSRFVPYSDISRINRAAAGEEVCVDAACMDCLLFGRDVWQASGGAFDVTIGPLYQILRQPDGSPRKPERGEMEEAKSRCGFHLLELDPDNFTVTPAVAGMRLDLGAIGKGYALDQAARLLRDRNVEHALLNAGESTVLGLGSMPEQDGWPVRAGAGEPVVLHGNALSGTGFMYKGAHIIDPRNFKTVDTERILRWAIAPNATLADALSTAFMVLNRREIDSLCRQQAGVRALFFQ
ncbi:MAG: FAD:protein FMN transferase [Verrucomicrobiales bacterium]|nr:FAD:protein FMN transferase [Verrucomicrobiales bacterium]